MINSFLKSILFSFVSVFNKSKQKIPFLTVDKGAAMKTDHSLKRNKEGLELCVGCGLCDRICPTGAIFVQSAPSREENPISTGESYAAEYIIDSGSCIFCGLCEQACPTGALVLTSSYGSVVNSKLELHRNKGFLLRETQKNEDYGADY
jgi:formate hydrogenlyase subunit 6/NADH:ubiquinone oxidoreductase subunit I